MLDKINYPIASPNLKGYQHIDGIWLPFIWFTQQQCANIILQYWFNGCNVYRFEQGYLLCFPYSIAGHCEQFDGWPLISIDKQLCSMQIKHHQKALLPNNDIILLMGNSIIGLDYCDSEIVNPSQWLNVDDYVLLEVDEWPIEVAELEYIDPTPDVKDISEVLGEKLPKPSKAMLNYVKKTAAQPQSFNSQQHRQSSLEFKYEVRILT